MPRPSLVTLVKRIVSGGQTGVDRAALDAALELRLPCGGWCPKGRRAEDGRLAARYPLKETPTETYEERTEWNVRDSDGTLILNRGSLSGGTALTIEYAVAWKKPYLVLDLDGSSQLRVVREWLRAHRIRALNVAGPRESKSPGIYTRSRHFLSTLLFPPRRL